MENMGILEKLESLRKQVESLDSSDKHAKTILVELPTDFYLLLIKAAEAYYTEKE